MYSHLTDKLHRCESSELLMRLNPLRYSLTKQIYVPINLIWPFVSYWPKLDQNATTCIWSFFMSVGFLCWCPTRQSVGAGNVMTIPEAHALFTIKGGNKRETILTLPVTLSRSRGWGWGSTIRSRLTHPCSLILRSGSLWYMNEVTIPVVQVCWVLLSRYRLACLQISMMFHDFCELVQPAQNISL